MEYLNIKEFAAFIYIAPATLFKKPCKPDFKKEVLAKRGRKTKLWAMEDVIKYKKQLVALIRKCSEEKDTLGKAAHMAHMGENQASKLLDEPEVEEKKPDFEANFETILKKLSQIGK